MGFGPAVRVNRWGDGRRVGLDLVGNDDALPLRNPLGVQQLPALITVDFLGRVLVEKLSADRYRRLVALGRLDTLLPDETIGKSVSSRALADTFRGRCRPQRQAREARRRRRLP